MECGSSTESTGNTLLQCPTDYLVVDYFPFGKLGIVNLKAVWNNELTSGTLKSLNHNGRQMPRISNYWFETRIYFAMNEFNCMRSKLISSSTQLSSTWEFQDHYQFSDKFFLVGFNPTPVVKTGIDLDERHFNFLSLTVLGQIKLFDWWIRKLW